MNYLGFQDSMETRRTCYQRLAFIQTIYFLKAKEGMKLGLAWQRLKLQKHQEDWAAYGFLFPAVCQKIRKTSKILNDTIRIFYNCSWWTYGYTLRILSWMDPDRSLFCLAYISTSLIARRDLASCLIPTFPSLLHKDTSSPFLPQQWLKKIVNVLSASTLSAITMFSFLLLFFMGFYAFIRRHQQKDDRKWERERCNKSCSLQSASQALSYGAHFQSQKSTGGCWHKMWVQRWQSDSVSSH